MKSPPQRLQTIKNFPIQKILSCRKSDNINFFLIMVGRECDILWAKKRKRIFENNMYQVMKSQEILS